MSSDIISSADTSWMLVSTALVMLMTPALGLFEAGLIRTKNSLSLIVQTFFGLTILSVLWVIVGFTLTFSPSAAGWGLIGGLEWFFFNGITPNNSTIYAPTIPGTSFASFQMMFAVITPLLITGAVAERMKWGAFVVFIIAWSFLIYYPLAHWVWAKDGWLARLGVSDFAGGIVIHTNAGMSSLAAAIVLGKRKNFGPAIIAPSNVPLAVIGAMLLWFGWFGFNAGSAFAAGEVASNALLVTQVAAAASGLIWGILSWKRSGKLSTIAVISGAIAGLAGVTPASGYIDVQSSLVLGIIVGLASYYAVILFKERLKIDDALDVGAVHGITGIAGSLLVGVFASTIINPSGPSSILQGNYAQLPIQGIGVAVAIALALGGTYVISRIIDATIGLRVSTPEEESGLDITQHAERAYID
ncbi:MAG TPA: ammonium transporter [Nitrososphaera sp.]|jgi:ammonium transporter, Amt family|nr:ammonium transporter [Nitrososphaera sp.]